MQSLTAFTLSARLKREPLEKSETVWQFMKLLNSSRSAWELVKPIPCPASTK